VFDVAAQKSFFIILNYFNVLKFKNIYYFNIFLNKKYLKKKLLQVALPRQVLIMDPNSMERKGEEDRFNYYL